MKSNIIPLLLFLIPFILLLCLCPGIDAAFLFSGIFSVGMYFNLIISARINAKIGGESKMAESSFFRFLCILIASISFGVYLTI